MTETVTGASERPEVNGPAAPGFTKGGGTISIPREKGRAQGHKASVNYPVTNPEVEHLVQVWASVIRAVAAREPSAE